MSNDDLSETYVQGSVYEGGILTNNRKVVIPSLRGEKTRHPELARDLHGEVPFYGDPSLSLRMTFFTARFRRPLPITYRWL